MHVRVVCPHQLFVEHLDAEADLVVLLEPDLFFRQYAFHTHKLVLHRAAMRRFEAELQGRGHATTYVESRAGTTTHDQLVALLAEVGADELSVYDVVDDWLDRDLRRVARAADVDLDRLETPAFLTTDEQVRAQFRDRQPRMAKFYTWQRRRLDVLVEGDQPVGGRWSYDDENRSPWPRKDPPAVPELPRLRRDDHVREAIAWVAAEFPDNPGDPEAFRWPTSHGQARRWLERFCEDRLTGFGPWEDAIATDETWLFHSALSPMINCGLLDPRDVLTTVLDHAASYDVPLNSLEGFVRQLIGWREYMRGAYVTRGRAMRTRNRLGLTRDLDPGWWDGTTGLLPVDTVVARVLEHGWCHHIERLMVLGNAMLLLRTDPDEVHEWFSALFVDAYDWVMVPNVYAMSQFAVAEEMTTKPYVSGSNYLRKMSDLPTGAWTLAWDALYWQFVDDYRDGFAANPRTSMAVRSLERMKGERRRELRDEARRWLG